MAAFRKLRQALGLRRPKISRYVSVGRHTYGVNEGTVVLAKADSRVTIGSFCSIGQAVQIHGASHHSLSQATTFPLRHTFLGQAEAGGSKGPVTIGHDVWIGTRAIILSNLTIGSGAVVGAGSVVTKDVAPYAIVAGNPARLVRFRFDPELVAALERIAWWNWPDEQIISNIDSFYGSIDDFVARFDPSAKRDMVP